MQFRIETSLDAYNMELYSSTFIKDNALLNFAKIDINQLCNDTVHMPTTCSSTILRALTLSSTILSAIGSESYSTTWP